MKIHIIPGKERKKTAQINEPVFFPPVMTNPLCQSHPCVKRNHVLSVVP